MSVFARRFGWMLALILGSLLLLSCSKPRAPVAPTQSRVWSEHVAAHTAGLVSRHSTISVRFVHDVAAANQDAAKVLSFEPPVAGSARFVTPRELVFTPAKPLPPGQGYLAKLDPAALKGLPEKLPPYAFNIHVIVPEFEVESAALESAATDDKAVVLRGTLATSDNEEPGAVERLLTARVGGQPLVLNWTHANENRTHQFFSAAPIERAERAVPLQLIWKGEPLGIKAAGERTLEVPQRGVFKVLDTQVQYDGRQSIRVHFSDHLDPNQNLASLVTLGKTKLATRVEGSTLIVYPESTVNGDLTLTLTDALRNARGTRLGTQYETTVVFANERPQVRFAGRGVILPSAETLQIPFEGMNVHSVQITAFQIFESDVGQFLQINDLKGDYELQRVGRHLWRKTLQLPKPQTNKWTRYTLDATELLKKYPGALFRLSLSINRGNSTLACSAEEQAVPVYPETPPRDNEDMYEAEFSRADGGDDYYDYEHGGHESPNWSDRDNPCKDAYYRWNEGIRDSRNFLASNIGLLAKRGVGGALHVVATELRDAAPLAGARIELRNFQNQPIVSAETDSEGFARIDPPATPFYLIARKGEQVGYLKLNRASALPTSHFDTGGETVSSGLKGFIYGERGVWRPGDNIYLNFVLFDRTGKLPTGHPATIQLYNPQGQLIQTLTNTQPVGDFYAFTLKTADDAPTGTWNAKVLIGGAEFSKALKIETVMPNRLKMELALPEDGLRRADMPVSTTLSAQWLHGASASGLKADVSVKLSPTPTRYTRYAEYVFDDPARRFTGEPETVFEARLDADGKAEVALQFAPATEPPGSMQAHFTTRVFENGGAFSTGHSSAPFHPFPRYVGLKLPKVEQYGYLSSGKDIPVDLVALQPKGERAPQQSVELSVYRVDWHWWWEREDNSLSRFAQANAQTPVSRETVTLADGSAKATFRIDGETWGRYLIRACDPDGGHCTGQVVYIGYAGWESNATAEDNSPGASALRFESDKPKYQAGETATLRLPAATTGRALLSIENGTSVLETRWVSLGGDRPELKLPITAQMAPNVFVSLTLLQPHAGKDNDRPIRLYGVIPVEVLDPATQLTPRIQSADLWRPNGKVEVKVSEAQGRAMTYTLAVVDEGLLGLTNFKTPNPHLSFYKREALGVQTWDLFDEVAGAYGAELERLLALGGDEGGPIVERQEDKRFPPVVRVLGPFQLAAGKTDAREIDLPNYIGAVRVMVVAGAEGAFGAAEKTVTVRDPLSLLATLPRVLGPGETLQMPVAAFAYEPDIREITLSIEADGALEIQGDKTRQLDFKGPGERMAWFDLKVKPRTGPASITVRAASGPHRTQTRIAIEVRASNPVIAKPTRKVLKPGEEWPFTVQPFGIENSNRVSLEVSRVPPIDLERRLAYLLQYPHGCIEQTTSGAFPQLYLSNLVELTAAQRAQTEANVKAGIERLRGFQTGNGAFAYWPGQVDVHDWSSNYAGHFLVEAKRAGYLVPAEMLDRWVEYQRNAANQWNARDHGTHGAGNHAYRLLTLALADHPDIGAMNRLRESGKLDPVARWMLAWAYAQAGIKDAARDVMRGEQRVPDYPVPGYSFGSDTRDRGILLSALMQVGDIAQAERVAEQLARELSSDHWYSTQSTAYALLGMARFSGGKPQAETFAYRYAAGKSAPVAVTARNAMSQHELPALNQGGALSMRNDSEQNLFVSVLQRGSPPPGEERAAASEGLELSVRYTTTDGKPLDIARLPQGKDFVARLRVTNRSGVNLDDLALTQIVASGWEISNPRFAGEGEQAPAGIDYQDIRDDRVQSYFKLDHGRSIELKALLNASYQGHYYLPAVSVESMYDARKQARTAGRWVDVVINP